MGRTAPRRTEGRTEELSPQGTFGWIVIDVETYERALELAGELYPRLRARVGSPIHEWLEMRPFHGVPEAITE
jgi:hypothetical protein